MFLSKVTIHFICKNKINQAYNLKVQKNRK